MSHNKVLSSSFTVLLLKVLLASLPLLTVVKGQCPTGFFRPTPGANCTLPCHCLDKCAENTGCVGPCDKGYLGPPKCQTVCSDGFFGESCSRKCHCNKQTCDPTNGSCKDGCNPDYTGAACDLAVPKLGQAPLVLNLTCTNLTLSWQPFNKTNTNSGDRSDFPIRGYQVRVKVNGSTTFADVVNGSYRHEVNRTKPYHHTVTDLHTGTSYKFAIRTDGNITVGVTIQQFNGKEGPETTTINVPPCPVPTTTVTTPTTTKPTTTVVTTGMTTTTTTPKPTTTASTSTTTTPPRVPGAPTKPRNLTLTLKSDNTIILNWTAPLSNDQTNYILILSKIGIGDCQDIAPDTSTTKTELQKNALSTTLTNLSPWTRYEVSLQAKNTFGLSFQESQTKLTNERAPAGVCSNLRNKSLTASSIVLTFEPPPCNQRNGFLRYYRISVNGASGPLPDYTSTLKEPQLTLTGLNPKTTYDVIVRFVNAQGTSGPSKKLTVETGIWTVTAKPMAGDVVRVTWDPMYPRTGDIINGYTVYYKKTTDANWVKHQTINGTSMDVRVKEAATYEFQVWLSTAKRWTPKSSLAYADTTNLVPSAPTKVTILKQTDTSFLVKWSAPAASSTKVTAYKVNYYVESTGLPVTPNTTAKEIEIPGKDNFTLTNLHHASQYMVKVSGKNSAGYGAYAEKLFYTPPGDPNPPKSPQVIETTDKTIKLELVQPTSSKGPVSVMFVSLLKKSNAKRRRRALAAVCQNGRRVVVFVPKNFTSAVEIGSGTDGSSNAPLVAATNYDICYGVESTYGGVTKAIGSTFDEKTTPAPGLDTVLIIVIVLAILLVLIVIIAIIVVIIVLKRKRRGADLGKTYSNNYTMNMDFDDTMYNIKPYGKWSDVHSIGEPRHIELVKDSVDADPNIIPIDNEYKALPHNVEYTTENALKPENKHKNRFEQFLPYDHSRVVLQSQGKDDYINANYLDGYKKPRAYIACQSPFNKDTVSDFWRMVCQENSLQIVMLSQTVEEAVLKSEQYWPDTGVKSYNGVKVRFISSDKFAYFVIRTFEVSSNPVNKKTVTHYQFTGWPMHGCPEDPIPFLEFIYKVRSMAKPGSGPVTVHSGTGISREAVYIAVDSLIQEGLKRGEVNVYKFCSDMRQNRYGMVRTLKQYLFIYDTLYEALLTADTVFDIDMRLGYTELISKNPMTGHTKLYEQFVIFRDYTPLLSDERCSDGFNPLNKRKNRFPNIVPPNDLRPKLKTPAGHGRNDYINAVILDSYSRKQAFIVTQTPLRDTIVDFWRLVYDHKISTIVMLHDRTYKEESSAEYWPKTLGNVRFDPFVVTLKTFVKERNLVISRTMHVNNSLRPSEKPHEVKQFQLDGDWMMYDHVPKDRDCVLQLIDAVYEHRKKTADHPETPILVHCIDGAARSGLFCCLMALVERMQIDRYADIFHAMKHLKRRRPQFVDDLEQYRFCYKALWDFINTRLVRLPQSVPRKDLKNSNLSNGAMNGGKKQKDRHLELTLAANDLDNYDYTLKM